MRVKPLPGSIRLPGFDDLAPAEPSPSVPPTSPTPQPSAQAAGLRYEVIRSRRRRRTISARLVDGVVRIHVPAGARRADEERWVADMLRRFERRHLTDNIDLPGRAATLARRYELPRPTSVMWADRMATRWGSCTPAEGTIRIAAALAAYPAWVLDYVLVHELAHLEVAEHSDAFWALVARYPRAERARGYLIAKSDADDADY